MDESKKNLVGSKTRDQFKRNHKNLDRTFYACDLDFVLVTKTPYPDIVAAIDYKTSSDGITFSEVIAYNGLIRRGINVYITIGCCDSGVFDIYEYKGGHHQRPDFNIEFISRVNGWDEFEIWERELRDSIANPFMRKTQ